MQHHGFVFKSAVLNDDIVACCAPPLEKYMNELKMKELLRWNSFRANVHLRNESHFSWDFLGEKCSRGCTVSRALMGNSLGAYDFLGIQKQFVFSETGMVVRSVNVLLLSLSLFAYLTSSLCIDSGFE